MTSTFKTPLDPKQVDTLWFCACPTPHPTPASVTSLLLHDVDTIPQLRAEQSVFISVVLFLFVNLNKKGTISKRWVSPALCSFLHFPEFLDNQTSVDACASSLRVCAVCVGACECVWGRRRQKERAIETWAVQRIQMRAHLVSMCLFVSRWVCLVKLAPWNFQTADNVCMCVFVCLCGCADVCVWLQDEGTPCLVWSTPMGGMWGQ